METFFRRYAAVTEKRLHCLIFRSRDLLIKLTLPAGPTVDEVIGDLLRHGYGGHPFGADEALAKERKTSRITKIPGIAGLAVLFIW